MARTLALTVHRVSDTQLRKCFLGRNPKLYIEIKIKTATSKQSYKTNAKVIRDSDTEWNEVLTFSIEESQTMRILLKATTFFGERVIGEIECKASDLLSPGTASPQNSLKVYRPRDKGKTRATGTIVTSARYTDSKPNPQELPSSENPHGDDIPHLPSETSRDPPRETQVALNNVQRRLAEAEVAIEEELGADSLSGRVGKVIERLKLLSGIVDTIAALTKLHPWVEFAWQVCTSLYKIVEKQRSKDEKIINLVGTMHDTLDFIEDVEKIKENAIRLESIITAMLKQVAECATFMCAYVQSSFAKRTVKQLVDGSDKKIDEFTKVLTELRTGLMEKVQISTALVSSKVLGGVEQLLLADALSVLHPTVMNAASRPLCLRGTREGVLQAIIDWVLDIDNDGQNILWLHDLAGTGKSTIADTISNHLHGLRRRGAFLFFERGKTERDTVIQTMAKQLATADPILQSKICAAINEDRSIVDSPLETQFEHLIRLPLASAAELLVGPIVIILDALDEYGDISSRRSLLTLISEEFHKLPTIFRFFITSRPESDIHSIFSGCSGMKDMSLGHLETTIPAVRLYLTSELAHIREEHDLPSDWPETTDMDRIARKSEGLFIWASTLANFLLTTIDPRGQLKCILSSEDKTYAEGLDNLYTTVLTAQTVWDKDWSQRFRDIAGVVLFCNVPLSDLAIDQLLALPEDKSSRIIFRRFRCLFDYDSGWPIRPLHASFRDYLTDESRSGGKPWSLVGLDAHYHLISCCFRIMSQQLHFNMCKFETLDRLNKDYPDLKERIKKHISPGLGYASMYWWRHLEEIKTWQEDVGSALRSFSEEMLLFWLEVVSLVGDVNETLRACDIVYTFAVDTDSKLATLWTNLRMFVREYTEAVSGSALHVYVSAHSSPFTKIHNWGSQTDTVVKLVHHHDIFPTALWRTTACKHYFACRPDRLLLLSDCSSGSLWTQWKPLSDKETAQSSTQLERPYPNDPHRRPDVITVSSDCRRVAGYFRNIRNKGGISIWDMETGRVVIHCAMSEDVYALVFHPLDSDQLATLSSKMISVWNIAEGKAHIMCSIKIDHSASQIAWSPDGTYLGSDIAVWSVDRTTATITLQRDYSYLAINALCFSPKTQSHILLAFKRALFLDDFKSNELVFGPYAANNLIPITEFQQCTFSPDGSLIAASSTYTIQIFETESGKLYQDPIVVLDWICQVTFLPDGKRIAALVRDTVYAWELSRGLQVSDQERFDQANTRGHVGNIASISFSPDGTKFLSSSRDGTVHVRSSTDCMLLREYWPMEYPQEVTAAVFSADNKTIYLALDDGTVQTSLGKVLYRPKERHQIKNFHVYVSQLTFKEHIVFSSFNSKKAFVIPSNKNPEQDLREISLEGYWDRFVVSSHGLIASFPSNSGTVKFINLEGDDSSHTLLITKYTQSVTLFFSQEGELVSHGKDERNDHDWTHFFYHGINVWDIKSATCLRTLSLPEVSGYVSQAALNANLLALTNKESIIIYDIEKGVLVHTFNSWNPLSYLDIHGSKLISSSHDQIIAWDLTSLHTDGTTPHTNATGTLPSIHSSSVSLQWSIRHEDHDPTGWVLGSNREHLLCVSRGLWYYLDPPGSTHVINRERRMKWPDSIPNMDWLKNYEGVGRLSMK
ncbi:hypothetical protein QCA50_020310 [Cerrena zonata]|uniref:C2 domain-containing protein n=1 Tax=Cerrena zonata TaxID=2478898 RepID=A0AAW0FF40_9APHY